MYICKGQRCGAKARKFKKKLEGESDLPAAGSVSRSRWARELTTRSPKQRASSNQIPSKPGFSNATLHQRLTAARLFFDFLIEEGRRSDNPVGRGRYTPGKGFGGGLCRGLVSRHRKLPWIPNDEQWQAILAAIKLESLRNRAKCAPGYDAALRREELRLLEISDFDFANLLFTLRAGTVVCRRFPPAVHLIDSLFLSCHRCFADHFAH
jgi:integrase/recombinase XerD